ncbi:MAG: alanine racemase, partial [Acidimicrobiia bacterium]
RALRSGPLELEGVCTHCAVADEPGNGFTAVQLERFADVLDALDRHGIEVPVRHAANSAALLTQPGAAYDLVRPGIALYGVAPAAALAGAVDLRPALRWRSRVSHVKRVRAGEGISYGHRHRFAADSVVATVPVGYADGLPRRWGLRGGVVLIGGVRRPVVGVVTMDQVMVDCGPDGGGVGRGDEAVLIGAQGDERIAVEELAGALDTIAYEILTGVGRRAERVAV